MYTRGMKQHWKSGLTALVVVNAFAICRSASGADVFWVGDQSDCFPPIRDAASFADGNYWLGYMPPGSNDGAIFQEDFDPQEVGTYPHEIYFGRFNVCSRPPCSSHSIEPIDAVIDSVRVHQGEWFFDFGSGAGGSACGAPSSSLGSMTARYLRVGDNSRASLTLRNGTFYTTIGSDDSVVVGGGDNGDGRLTLAGPTTRLQCSGVWLGNGGGRGRVEVLAGARVVGGIGSGPYAGSDGALSYGEVLIAGEGSFMGPSGGTNHGFIEILDGAQVSAIRADGTRMYSFIAVSDESVARVTVRGTNSSWTGSARLTVGGVYHTDTNGRGTLTVADGGEVACDELIVGNRSRSSGEVLIAGTGTRLTAAGWVVVGDDGMGTCHVDNRAELRCSELVIGSTTNGRGQMRLSETAACANSGTLTVSYGGIGELQVSSGAMLTTHDARIGNLERAGIEGNVCVTDPGSELSATDTIRLNRGSLSVFSGGAIIASALEMNSPEATLQGDGVIETVAVLHHAGRIRPGRHDSLSSPAIGELTNEGDLLQDDNAVLEIELARGTTAGTSDRVNVTGSASLAGTLDLRRSGPAQFELGDEFEILTAAGIDGRFSTILGQALPGGRILRVDYGAQSVTLTVVEQSTGDTDCDGHMALADIDSFVLAIISREGFERAHPDCEYALADINRDGSVDFADIDAFVALLQPGS